MKEYDALRQLDVEKLEELLQAAVDPQNGDEDSEYVDTLLKIIVEKEREHNTGRLSNVEEMWQEFRRHRETEESLF
jgi:hypothetical protein